jgi:TBC1 domain family member 15
MVQIPSFAEQEHATQQQDTDQHRLMYSKSKVYVHPTAYSRDNIPGFIALAKQVMVAALYYSLNR